MRMHLIQPPLPLPLGGSITPIHRVNICVVPLLFEQGQGGSPLSPIDHLRQRGELAPLS